MIELTSKQLRYAADLKDKIHGLQSELNHLLGGTGGTGGTGNLAATAVPKKRRKHRMSAEGRARMSAAAKKRWAKIKAAKK